VSIRASAEGRQRDVKGTKRSPRRGANRVQTVRVVGARWTVDSVGSVGLDASLTSQTAHQVCPEMSAYLHALYGTERGISFPATARQMS
jgi:hypothetical protein